MARVPRQLTGRYWSECGLDSSAYECSSWRRSLRSGCTSASNSPTSTIQTTRQLASRFAGIATMTSTSITKRSGGTACGSAGGIDTRTRTTHGITFIRRPTPAGVMRRTLSGRETIETCAGSFSIASRSASRRYGRIIRISGTIHSSLQSSSKVDRYAVTDTRRVS